FRWPTAGFWISAERTCSIRRFAEQFIGAQVLGWRSEYSRAIHSFPSPATVSFGATPVMRACGAMKVPHNDQSANPLVLSYRFCRACAETGQGILPRLRRDHMWLWSCSGGRCGTRPHSGWDAFAPPRLAANVLACIRD